MANMVPCTGCNAEISDDRKACPHCLTLISSPKSQLTALQDLNDQLQKQIDEQIAKEKQRGEDLKAQLAGKPPVAIPSVAAPAPTK